MKRLPIGPLVYEYSRHLEPRLRIEPGETIVVESEDAFSGQIRTNADRRDKSKMPFGNPQTGPILVEGAEPGDALAVKIESIRPLIGQCATRTSEARQLTEWLGARLPARHARLPDHATAVFIGATSIRFPTRRCWAASAPRPTWGRPRTLPAGPHGGNMDIVEVCPGNTVYLPVYVPGGYLYLGRRPRRDGARRAFGQRPGNAGRERDHGRLCQAASGWPGPRIETADEIMTVVSGCPMERATA